MRVNVTKSDSSFDSNARLLLDELQSMILSARQEVAQTVNTSLVVLHWNIGNRIRQDILQEKRAGYGEQIVASIAKDLTLEYGRGFGYRNLFNMVRFAEVFPDKAIMQSLIAQLTWTHLLHIITIEDPLKRDFYAEMCRIEKWSTRTLSQKIQSMLFERTALSRKPDELIKQEIMALREQDQLTPDLVFRDPYLLGFLGLKDAYAEKDLEAAILREMELFLLELGVGFAFVARQKRITVDGDDYYLDLLFFHRRMRRLVAIELKLGDFKPADKGQMEFYLRWLDQHERGEGEESPLGLILCAGKKAETVRLLDLKSSGIHIAEYWTELMPRKELEQKLGAAVRIARSQIETNKQ